MKDSFKVMAIAVVMGFVLLMAATSYSQNQYKNSGDYKLFMKYCAVENDMKNYCDCSYRKLTSQYSYVEMMDLLNTTTDNISPEIYEVAEYCIKEI